VSSRSAVIRAQKEDKEGQEVDKVEKKSSGKLHSAWKYFSCDHVASCLCNLLARPRYSACM
jgi:hypothetical protein